MHEILSQIEPELAAILKAELAAGNAIAQVGSAWPRPGAICVQLKERFKQRHIIDEAMVKYGEDQDPHGPVAEYVSIASGNSLLCSLFP